MRAIDGKPERSRPTPGMAHGIIPTRYASTRFPGKPLLLLHGKPMFYHVWQRACRCPALTSVTLATDDDRIASVAEEYGVPYVMTAVTHESGTDRVYEAAQALRLPPDAVVVNIQGDEPALNPAALSDLLTAFDDPQVEAATLAHLLDPADLHRPDKVKVVTAVNGDALYFSRAPIPFFRAPVPPVPSVPPIPPASSIPPASVPAGGETPAADALGHIGLYAFTMRLLSRFVSLPPSLLERTEKLEQLRLLENNLPIRVIVTQYISHGVDTPEDVERVLPLL